MNEIDYVFLKKDFLGEKEIEFLKSIEEERTMLIEINKKIADSVEKEELDYWKEMRSDFYRMGEKFVKERIEGDKLNGILTESGEFNGR